METEVLKVAPQEITLLEQNARYMGNQEYNQLVKNIKIDGSLTSVPLCCYDKHGNLVVISGNHRVMAAIDAGLREIQVLVIKSSITESEMIAIQLSHNAIVGKDDATILKDLYSKLDTIKLKEYSGLSEDYLKECQSLQKQLKEPKLNYQIFNLVFLEDEICEIIDTVEEINLAIKGHVSIVSSMSIYDEAKASCSAIADKLGVKNQSTAFLCLIRLAKKYIDDVQSILKQ